MTQALIPSSSLPTTTVLAVCVAGALVTLYAVKIQSILSRVIRSSKLNETSFKGNEHSQKGLIACIGNTPLIRIGSLSEATGCEIYGKAEFLNPGGSVKDRVALRIVQEGLERGELSEGGLITEGSAGSTAVSLALVASAFRCRTFVALPDDAAREKGELLEALGAEVMRVRPVSITHPDHFVNIARRKAQVENLAALEEKNEKEFSEKKRKHKGAFFADQFENLANFRAHYEGTGKEIWEQTRGKVDAFVAASGTGGTIAGVSQYLKDQNPEVKCYLIDPQGSSLYNKISRGVLFTKEESEGKRLRNPFDTITEGIGINRMTKNFEMAKIDGAFKGTDREAVEMAQYLLREEGLFLGSSAAMNCVGAVKMARKLGPGNTIVTILCDGGHRHLSKFHNPRYLSSLGLFPSATSLEFIVS